MREAIHFLYKSANAESGRVCGEIRAVGRLGRSAFTLVELLVVVGVIGVLVALLLPAANSFREASRNVSCKDRVRQIALASLTYESSHAHFPVGQLGPSDNDLDGTIDFPENQMVGHLWFVLPFLELQNFQESIFVDNLRVDLGGPSWFEDDDNFNESNRSLAVFRCPSDFEIGFENLSVGSFNLAGNQAVGVLVNVGIGYEGWTNYLGSSGRFEVRKGGSTGVFSQRKETKVSEVSDGLSNTIFFGEILGGVQGPLRELSSRASLFNSGVATERVFSQPFSTGPTDAPVIFSSRHQGGESVNFSYVDGHVAAASSSVDTEVLSRLFSKADGN